MSSEAIKLEHITKVYKLYNRNRDRLKDSLGLTKKKCYTEHFALRDVSMEIHQGETVGIIGVNGSGKSTILKIITGVLTPTTGQVDVEGKISALLELGAGFNMDYTGIENIYMNGTMMGYSRKEMDEKLQDILDFADIGDFVYQPVKTYSSGMFVRLAFALNINVEPEILIVDEALSVGDVFFQAKCYRKMEEIKQRGTTILMVTHDMGSIIKYCDKVVLLNKGEFIAEGEPGHMVDLYKKILANQLDSLNEELESDYSGGMLGDEKKAKAEESHSDGSLMKDKITINTDRTEYGDGRAEIFDLGLFDAKGNLTNLLLKGEMFTIKERIRFHAPIKSPIFTYTIRDKKGTDLTGTNTMYEKADVKGKKEGESQEITFTQKLDLQGGEYLISLGCTGYRNGEFVVFHRLYDVCSLTVISDRNTVGYYDMNSKVTLS